MKKNISQAKVVDGKLILSCPNAVTPIVWQMDLTEAKSSAFEVTQDQDNEQSVLVTRKQGTQKKDVIAPFATKDHAVQALMATAHALENAQGQIAASGGAGAVHAPTPAASYATAPVQKKSWGKSLIIILALLMIAGLYMTIQNLQPAQRIGGSAPLTSTAGASPGASGEAGVPMSADDFLRQN